jgi:hypothetical protein
VEAALVLDVEAAILVENAGVRLGDGRLRQAKVVVPRASQRVGAGLEEIDLLREVPALDFQEGDREASPAMHATLPLGAVLATALRTQHA